MSQFHHWVLDRFALFIFSSLRPLRQQCTAYRITLRFWCFRGCFPLFIFKDCQIAWFYFICRDSVFHHLGYQHVTQDKTYSFLQTTTALPTHLHGFAKPEFDAFNPDSVGTALCFTRAMFEKADSDWRYHSHTNCLQELICFTLPRRVASCTEAMLLSTDAFTCCNAQMRCCYAIWSIYPEARELQE